MGSILLCLSPSLPNSLLPDAHVVLGDISCCELGLSILSSLWLGLALSLAPLS